MTERQSCSECYGAGYRMSGVSFWGFPERRQCWKCNGTGQVEKETK